MSARDTVPPSARPGPPDERRPARRRFPQRERDEETAPPRLRADTTATEQTDARVTRRRPPTTTAPGCRGRRRRLALALVLLVLGVAAVAGVAFLSGDYRQERPVQAARPSASWPSSLAMARPQHVYRTSQRRPASSRRCIIDKFVDLVARHAGPSGRFVRADRGDRRRSARSAWPA